MKRYLLIIPDRHNPLKFEADDLASIRAMITLGDNYTLVDTHTGATIDNHYLKIDSLF